MNTNMSGNQAGRSAPQQDPRANVEQLSNALQGAQNEIQQLNRQHDIRTNEWQKERIKLGYRIHNGKYKVDRLEGLIDLRQNAFAEELQSSIQTVSEQESEISGLKISLRIKEEQMEAAQRLNKEQEEKLSAALQAERQNVSELRDQMFKASLESQRAVALSRESQMMLELVKQQLQQRDKVILDLRKEKEGLSQRLIQTSDQLRRTNNQILQKNPGEEKLKALKEQFSKEMEDKEKEWTSKINEVKKENRDLEEKNQTLTSRVTEVEKDNQDLVKKQDTLKTRVLEVESENIRLSEQERILTSRVREEEEEKKELMLLMTLKKRNFFTRILKRETGEEKILRKRLREKKKELKDQKKEEENRQREEAEEEKRRKVEAEKELKKQQKREKEDMKQKEKDEKKKQEETREKKGFWRFRRKGNGNRKVEEAAEEQQ
ncbi:trichohyalin-like [Notolabrus celidotus]|uniref:trichohyalin-like n=1 Tax=Notolabrus celidotus TaxID=1203425 RepID=UPI00148FA754|nr:trichohyalin-like [Notolabrus celidotus]